MSPRSPTIIFLGSGIRAHEVLSSCKQVLTIALAVVLFDLHISPTNALGILLTLIGGVLLFTAVVLRSWVGYLLMLVIRGGTHMSNSSKRGKRT